MSTVLSSANIDPQSDNLDTEAQPNGRDGGRAKATDIREAIEQEILTGLRKPGAKLDEKGIADRFAVSRTPVREALQQLATAGLIELIPHRGAFVRSVSIRELIEMFEVMAELEGMAGRLAARRVDADMLAVLQKRMVACRTAAESQDPDAYYHENERFHRAIYEACGNAFLEGEAKRLHQRLQAFRRLQLRVPKRIDQSLAEHETIVEAIDARDEAGCEQVLRNHILIQGERFADFVALLDEPATGTAGS
ncbi:GntR family transcriptional regulator [Notoacmeibacter sp. MSK16QG-6]|uniref:GntR family transcriptional regulator n=1 Tax=Notoacmeibacter sp. MSK16QG-6 TaxID=2957982 RepID=UPI00209F179C|nr:GntR family transcriptional regulator [Notoacmeibacter sp. MSK16QG-6]MCP1200351.1 GntR family transcriptional regulator [Notoacmeibacter sp. MSK16QG-6]